MATFNKQILGKVQGALGEVTFRQRNGKTYLSTRPGSFIPGSDENSVARREKFSLSIKLASAINSVPLLKSIWDKNTPADVTTFNHIMRTNYAMIGSGDLSGLVKLIPSMGFNVANPVVTLGPLSVKVNLDAIGNSAGIDITSETAIKLISVLYLSNPSDSSLSKNEFVKFVSASKPIDLASALEFNIALSDVESQMYSIYQNRKSFFAVVTLDAAGNAVHYSNTFAG